MRLPIVLLALSMSCAAQAPTPWLLGDFDGARPRLETDGLAFDLFYNAYFGWNARGGANTSGARRYSHSLDFFARADTEALGLWSDGSALLQVKSNYGESINPDVGALSQPVDDADFTEPIYVDQLYYEHELGAARLRLGYLDYQTIVDRNAYANSEDVQFMNAALDNNPIVPLKIGFGAALFVSPTDWLDLTIGTADADNKIRNAGWDTAFGDSDGLMAYGEITLGHEIDTVRGELPGKFRFGGFYDPRSRLVFAEMRTRSGSSGAYVSFDQMLYREQPDSRQGMGLFFRWGWRDPEVHAITRFRSLGIEYRGAFEGRDDDALGVGYYSLKESSDFRTYVQPGFGGELGVEVYYRFEVTPWFAITPDVQYVRDPGGLSTARDALAFVLRARVRF